MNTNPPSKRWVDYSDSDSPDESEPSESPNSPPPPKQKSPTTTQPPAKKTYRPSKQQLNKQLDLLDRLDKRRVDEVWVDIFSENIDYLEEEIDYLRNKARKGGNIVQVISTEDPQLYQVKVYINLAYDYIQDGYDPQDYVRVSVAERNSQEGRRQGKARFEEKRQNEKRRNYDNKAQRKRVEYQKKQDEGYRTKEKKQQTEEMKKQVEKEEQQQKEGKQPESPKKTKAKLKEKKGVTSKYASKNPFESLEGL